MQNDFIHFAVNRERDSKDVWRDRTASTFRLACEFDDGGSAGTRVDAWNLGPLDLLTGRFAHLSLTPLDDGADAWLYLKLIRQGAMNIEQGSKALRVLPGQIVLVESTKPYRQSFTEPTQMIALRVSERALRQRGFRHDLREMVVPDMSSTDARSIGDLVVAIAAQHGATSANLRGRQGEQLLDLIDFLVDDPSALARVRRGDATLFRAKRFIDRNLRNPDLTVSQIASAVCVSEVHLCRLFSAAGQSLMRYVWQCRLARAADMLKRSGKGSVQISEIAYRCGFSTATHFSRAFRERYGMSPREALGKAFQPR